MFAERMTKAELAFFKSVAGGREPPKIRVRILPGASRERIDHPNKSGHHDDLSNVCAGAMWRASQQQGVTVSPELLTGSP